MLPILLFIYVLHFLTVKSETSMYPLGYHTEVNERLIEMKDILFRQAALMENHSKRIKQLEDIVDNQNSMIQIQRKNLQNQAEHIDHLQNDFKYQVNQIQNLENTVHDHRNEIITLTSQLSVVKSEQFKYNVTKPRQDHVMTTQDEALHKQNLDLNFGGPTQSDPLLKIYRRLSLPDAIKKDRRLLLGSPTSTPPTRATAFYAYIGHHERSMTNHHTLIFDTVKTNSNGAYSQYTGVFTVPVGGFFGFAYTIRMGCHTTKALGPFEIIRNSDVAGVVRIDDQSCNNQVTVTGVITLHVTKGDNVYIRTKEVYSEFDGNVYSDVSGRTSFAGWSIQYD